MGFAVNMDAWRLGNRDYWSSVEDEYKQAQEQRLQAQELRTQSDFDFRQGQRNAAVDNVRALQDAGTPEDVYGTGLKAFNERWGQVTTQAPVAAPSAAPTGQDNAVANNVVVGSGLVMPDSRPQWAGDPRQVLQQIQGIRDPAERQGAMDSYRAYLNRQAGGEQPTQPIQQPVARGLAVPAVDSVQPENAPVGIQQRPAESPQQVDPRLAQLQAIRAKLNPNDPKAMETLSAVDTAIQQRQQFMATSQIMQRVIGATPQEQAAASRNVFGSMPSLSFQPGGEYGLGTVTLNDKPVSVNPTMLGYAVSGQYLMSVGRMDEGYKMFSQVYNDVQQNNKANNEANSALGVATRDAAYKTETLRRQGEVAAAQTSAYNNQANRREKPQIIQLQNIKTGEIAAFDLNQLPVDPATGRFGIPDGYAAPRTKTDPQVKLQLASNLVKDGSAADINQAMLIVDRQYGESPDPQAVAKAIAAELKALKDANKPQQAARPTGLQTPQIGTIVPPRSGSEMRGLVPQLTEEQLAAKAMGIPLR